MHLKKKTFRKFFLVTIEPQYANQIDSVPSQSFMRFKLHNRLKKEWKTNTWSSVSQCAPIAGRNTKESMGGKGLDWFLRLSDLIP